MGGEVTSTKKKPTKGIICDVIVDTVRIQITIGRDLCVLVVQYTLATQDTPTKKDEVFLCWCVLGSEGVLHHKDTEITTDGDLDSNGIYYYVTDDAFGGFFFRRRYFPAHVEVLTTWYLADKMLFVRWTPRLSSKGRIYHQRVPAVVQTSVVQYRNAMDIVYSL